MVKKVISLSGLFVVFFSLLSGPSILWGRLLSIIAIVSVVYPMVISVKLHNYHITIFYVFVINYILVPFNYFWLNKSIMFYNPCERLSNVFLVLQIISVFHFILLYKIKISPNTNKRNPFVEYNPTAFWVLLGLSIFLVVFYAPMHTIFEKGSYGEAHSLNEGSTLFIYSIIPITLSLMFANTPLKKQLLYFVVLLFCIRNMLTGGRVESIMLLLALFLLRFQYIWNIKTMIFAAIIGTSIFHLWGLFRDNINQDIIGLYANMIVSIFTDSGVDFQSGNSANVYYSSLRVIYLIEENILTWDLRLNSLFYFFVSTVVPYSMLPPHANLSSFLQGEYWSGGGGLGPVFMYSFCGWLGVILFSLFVVSCINKFNVTKNKYVFYYLVLLIASTPRWYAYYPIQLFKFCVIGMFLYIIMNNFKTNKFYKIRKTNK